MKKIISHSFAFYRAISHLAVFKFLIGITLLFAATVVLYAGTSAQPQAPAAGILILVDSTGDGVNMGSGSVCDDGTGHCTLRAAIQLANGRNNGSDTISISATGTISLSSVLPNLNVPVSIHGPGAASLTVARGASIFRIFNVTTSGTVSLSGLTISNGLANGDGGGLQNSSTGIVNLTNCTFIFNQATNGGGISNATTGRVNLTGCFLASNEAALQNGSCNGGGVYNGGGTVTITNSFLLENVAFGGQNFRGFGGGVYNNGTLIVVNSTIAENQATSNSNTEPDGLGGGIYNAATAIISNSTIAINSTANDTGRSSGTGGVQSAGTITQVKSTIIARNGGAESEPDVSGPFSSAGFNLIGATDGSTGFTAATDQTGTVASYLDPKFNDLWSDNGGPTKTMALLCGSPAIDKGTSNSLTGTLTTDQRGTGFARTVDDSGIPNASGGDGTDIGAFEYGAGPIMPTSVVSRKFHGTGNPPPHFDIPLPLSCASMGVECRRNTGADTTGPNVGHDHELVVSFGSNVSTGSVDVLDDSTGFPAGTATLSGNNSSVVTVDLHSISNPASLTVNLRGLSDGTNTGLVSVPMGVLLGDVNGSGVVTSGDANLCKGQALQPITNSNFRDDINVSGTISSGDVNVIKQHALDQLPH